MKEDSSIQALRPFNFSQILEEVPELGKFAYRIDSYTFDPIIDSSDVEPSLWVSLAGLIEERYDSYDGFVILHGTDTMAYSASALSFMIEGLTKPVIFTGSQLHIIGNLFGLLAAAYQHQQGQHKNQYFFITITMASVMREASFFTLQFAKSPAKHRLGGGHV